MPTVVSQSSSLWRLDFTSSSLFIIGDYTCIWCCGKFFRVERKQEVAIVFHPSTWSQTLASSDCMSSCCAFSVLSLNFQEQKTEEDGWSEGHAEFTQPNEVILHEHIDYKNTYIYIISWVSFRNYLYIIECLGILNLYRILHTPCAGWIDSTI